MTTAAVDVSIVVPVYKEEHNIRPFLQRTVAVMDGMGVSYEIVFALDPSPDGTLEAIEREMASNPGVKLLLYSRRFGQPAATLGGILNCTGRTCVVIDVDLQDPPELIPALHARLAEGYEVVCARRRSRKGETMLKRLIAHLGYAAIARLSDVDIPRNTGDFRIMTRRVIEELRRLPESHGFLRGLVAHVGFRQSWIEYDRDERFSGKGNYNRLTGSLRIGLNGIVSFGSRPLQLMSLAGFLLTLSSLLLAAGSALASVTGVRLGPDLSGTALAVSFFSGVQLLALGLMGEYVGRIYDEVKRRPPYIIDRKMNFMQEQQRNAQE